MLATAKNESAPSVEKSISARFRDIFDLDKDTIRALAHSKRFLERWTVDEDFRAAIIDERMSLGEAQELCGCEIDVSTLQPIFHPDYFVYRRSANLLDWPLSFLWDTHLIGAMGVRDAIAAAAGSNGLNPAFDQWRARNINRASLQLDVSAIGITHPPVAFELSSGCSVGCWFCGISAKQFNGHATLADGGDVEWRKTLEAVRAVVGDGMQCGFCYWATDPLDNPEYAGFIRIFEEVTGVIPQTTTAIPMRDTELTREVLRIWRERKTTPNRFSVMTKRKLLEIHKEFTPDELYGVELVLQTGKELAVTKFAAGRNYDKSRSKENSHDGTIACVTGFLVNIVEKTVKLISPTMPSEKWPDGYIVFASQSYSDADELRFILEKLVSDNMRPALSGNKKIRLADGATFDRKRSQRGVLFRKIEVANDFIGAVGTLLSGGESTPIGIAEHCMQTGMPLITAVAELEKIWQEGVVVQDA